MRRIFLLATIALFAQGTAVPAPLLAQTSDAAAGQKLYAQRCASCHSLTTTTAIGPHLAGVMGRKPASAPNYVYSGGLKKLNTPWTRETLDAFLKAPAKAAPGTKMVIAVPNDAQRSQLLDYLTTLR